MKTWQKATFIIVLVLFIATSVTISFISMARAPFEYEYQTEIADTSGNEGWVLFGFNGNTSTKEVFIDFVRDEDGNNPDESKPCLEFAHEFLKNEKLLFIAGNHEYAKYDGKTEDMIYRMNSLQDMNGGLGINIFFNSRIVGGINFVGIDDAYHQVEEGQLMRLKKEVEKGFPVILFMHAPLYEKSDRYEIYRCKAE